MIVVPSKTEIVRVLNPTAEKHIEELNLNVVMYNLKKTLEWSETELQRAILSYRKFLILGVRYPTLALIPTRIIREVWACHRFSVSSYLEDCKEIFGEDFLLRIYEGDDIEKKFSDMNQLWRKEFGYRLIKDII